MQHGVLAPPSRQNILFSTGSVRMGQNDPSLESSPPPSREHKNKAAPILGTAFLSALILSYLLATRRSNSPGSCRCGASMPALSPPIKN